MRGLIGQLVGTLAGVVTVTVIRALMGLPAWAAEPAWVVGGLFGGIGFMLGVGAMTDWIKWMRGIDTPMHHGPPVASRPGPATLAWTTTTR